MRALLAMLCLAAALGNGGRATAHAQLVAAEPPAGAVLKAAPSQVDLRFNEPVAALFVRWITPDGEVIEIEPRVVGATLVAPAPHGLGQGTHLVSWRVASADGHPIGGSHVFSVGVPSAAVDLEPAGGSARLAAAARGLLTLTLVFGVGGAVFLRLIDRGDTAGAAGRFALGAALATPAVAALTLGAQGLDLIDAPLAGLAHRAPWAAALDSTFAATAATAGAAGVTAAVALARWGGRWLAGLAWGLAALSFALSGHAATAPPAFVTAPSVALHGAAFVFWIGALPGMAARARGGGDGLAPLLRRFSAAATPLVAVLVATGAALAVVQVGRPEALIDTAYGRLLVAKLAAVTALLSLAALNRFALTPAIAAGHPEADRRLLRSVAGEIALGFLILALASSFRLTPPPRTLDASAPLEVHAHGDAAMATIRLRPGRAGRNAVEIAITGHDMVPLAPLDVAIAFADPARGVEPIRLEAEPDGPMWHAGPVYLPYAAQWSATVEFLISDFEQETLSATIPLPED